MATKEELKPLIGTPTKVLINGYTNHILLLAVGDEVATLMQSADSKTYKPAEVVRINLIDLRGSA